MEIPSDSAASTPRTIIPESTQDCRRSKGKSALNARRRTAIDQAPSSSAANQRLRSIFLKIRSEMKGDFLFLIESTLGPFPFLLGIDGSKPWRDASRLSL